MSDLKDFLSYDDDTKGICSDGICDDGCEFYGHHTYSNWRHIDSFESGINGPICVSSSQSEDSHSSVNPKCKGKAKAKAKAKANLPKVAKRTPKPASLVILDEEDEAKPVVKRKFLRTPDYLAFFKGNPKVPELAK